ncbi:MAG: GAF domain-containing protein [Acidobacteriia bacterium]|nr:GAF domain-containing protein [Terriglobia bacterium]
MPKVKELEQQFERVEMQLRLYQKISRFFTRPIPLDEALQSIVALVAEFMHADSCLLYLISGEELVLCAAKGLNPGAVGEVKLRLEEGLTGWVARERRVLAISREAHQDARFKFFQDLPEDTYEAFLSAPILARNRVAGVINLQHRTAHAHSGDEVEMVSTVGTLIGCLVALSVVEPARLDEVEFADLVLAGRES